MTAPPPSVGQRITWADLPSEVRVGIELVLGGRVVETWSESGGFSPGTADRVRTDGGRPAFVKAVSPAQNPHAPDLLRREADYLEGLAASRHVPAPMGLYDDGTWIALIMEEIEGRCPPVPWSDEHVELAMTTLAAFAAETTPSPLPGLTSAVDGLRPLFTGWTRLRENSAERIDPWVAAHLETLEGLALTALEQLHGCTVVHCDVRADNLLIRENGSMVIVDWPWAMAGPPWLDRFLLLINIDLYGGHDVDALVDQHLAEIDPELITGTLAGLCAYFTDAARQAPLPGLPTLRAFQQAQADSTTAWLRRRLAGGRWA